MQSPKNRYSELVLNSASMKQSMIDRGIIHQLSTPYRHFQNSVEREVQTYIKGVSLLLHSQQWLQANQWDLAVHHFADVRNHTPNVHHAFKSPDHRVNGKATNLSKQFQFAFGDLVAVGIPKELRDWKFDLRNDIGIYVGQPRVPLTQRTSTSRIQDKSSDAAACTKSKSTTNKYFATSSVAKTCERQLSRLNPFALPRTKCP